MREWLKGLLLIIVFLVLYAAPVDAPEVLASLAGGLALLQEYARLHVLTCLVPAFFIAGTIAVYVKKDALLRLLGPAAPKRIAYPVASVSGGILAVCSCTILPLFTGIYRRGAGIGPATAFLFSGPAVNVTAILLTGSVLGWDFAVGRLVASVVIAVAAGLVMAYVFRHHDRRGNGGEFVTEGGNDLLYSNALITAFFALQLGVLVVFGLSLPPALKGTAVVLLLAGILSIVLLKLRREHASEWVRETWELTKKIVPYLFVGVFAAGMIETVIPGEFVTGIVGENTIVSNLIASTFGAFMYFATLTEVPMVQKLMGLGMGRGPAMTLFLTGNALSLPSMLVLFSVMGRKQATVYVLTIAGLSVLGGFLFGLLT